MGSNKKENNLYEIGSLQGKKVKQILNKKDLPANIPTIFASTPRVKKIKLRRDGQGQAT